MPFMYLALSSSQNRTVELEMGDPKRELNLNGKTVDP